MIFFVKKIRNFFRILKKPFIKKKDFWKNNIPEINEENKKLIESVGEHTMTPQRMIFFVKKIRNFFRILKKPFIKKKDFWKNNIPEIDEENKKLIDSVGEYTMTPLIRRWALIKSLHYINKNKLIGDIVESGVWRGGNLFLSKKVQDKYYKEIQRNFYGYDTFEGMPEPSIHDGKKTIKIFNEFKTKKLPWIKVSLDRVKSFSKNLFLDPSNIIFIKGRVEDSLRDKKNLPNKISLLRLDTDFYESTKIELEVLYPLLVEKGVLIIDDYGDFPGCRKAVDEFFYDKNILITSIDKSCRLIIKNHL
jgi:O-methyltransferase